MAVLPYGNLNPPTAVSSTIDEFRQYLLDDDVDNIICPTICLPEVEPEQLVPWNYNSNAHVGMGSMSTTEAFLKSLICTSSPPGSPKMISEQLDRLYQQPIFNWAMTSSPPAATGKSIFCTEWSCLVL